MMSLFNNIFSHKSSYILTYIQISQVELVGTCYPTGMLQKILNICRSLNVIHAKVITRNHKNYIFLIILSYNQCIKYFHIQISSALIWTPKFYAVNGTITSLQSSTRFLCLNFIVALISMRMNCNHRITVIIITIIVI